VKGTPLAQRSGITSKRKPPFHFSASRARPPRMQASAGIRQSVAIGL
jgi:hypothetical protein